MKIQLFGAAGCPSCRQLEEITFNALAELDLAAEVEKVVDVEKMIEYDVYMLPEIIINGKTKAAGRVPTKEEIKRFLLEEK